MQELKEPKGIPFFNIKSGDTHHAKTESQIQAYINSSDMGINASRGQDFGWRLGADWVKKIRAFQGDEDSMDALAGKLRLEDGVSPTVTQILYYIYGRQIRAYMQRLKEGEAPYELKYQRDISDDKPQKPVADLPADEVTEDVDEADLEPAGEESKDTNKDKSTDRADDPAKPSGAKANTKPAKPASKKS